MEPQNQRPFTEKELKAIDAKAKADAEAKAKAEQKPPEQKPPEQKPPIDIRAQLKAAVSPNVWAQVEAILAKIKPEMGLADRQKVFQQLGGFYSGKLFLELKKFIFKK